MSYTSRMFSPIARLAALLWLAGLLSACQTPLDRDYPVSWPELSELSFDGTEINGTFANVGTLTTENGEQRPITLAHLIPTQPGEGGPLKPVSADFAQTRSVSIAVHNPSKESGFSEKPWEMAKKAYASMREIEFASDAEHGTETVKVDGASIERSDKKDAGYVLHYVLESSGYEILNVWYGSSSTGIWLTKAADGSLIAVLEELKATVVVRLIPWFSRSLTWARFPRIEP